MVDRDGLGGASDALSLEVVDNWWKWSYARSNTVISWFIIFFSLPLATYQRKSCRQKSCLRHCMILRDSEINGNSSKFSYFSRSLGILQAGIGRCWPEQFTMAFTFEVFLCHQAQVVLDFLWTPRSPITGFSGLTYLPPSEISQLRSDLYLYFSSPQTLVPKE